MRLLLSLALLPLAGCALVKPPGPTAVLPHASDPWRIIATDKDRERLRDWRDSFVGALDDARKGGRAADIAREGPLLDPDAAAPNAVPAAGDYRCRWVKLGGEDSRQPRYVAYSAEPCRIGPPDSAKAMTFEFLAGPQRPVGRFLPETYDRMVFLGTLQIGDERGTLRYGDDKQRDMAGFLERIGERRWRIILPEPHFESQMDAIELVPAG
jgi:hypothetical protein